MFDKEWYRDRFNKIDKSSISKTTRDKFMVGEKEEIEDSFNPRKLKGEIRLEYSAKINEYFAYDENGFICGTIGVNKEKLEEIIKRSNEYEHLKAMTEKQKHKKVIKTDSSSQSCPRRGRPVNSVYCPGCGQRLTY